MPEPKVSVLIPTYNQEAVIEETLQSTISQDYGNLEIIVADDASQDGTPAILKHLQAQYPTRLKVFLYENNLGVTRNHTRGLFECTGEFIAFQDGDDLFLPGKIKKQVAFMQARPECGLSFHDVEVFKSETGEILYYWAQRFGHREGAINKLVRYGNYLCSVSVMVRKKHLPSYGYDDRVKVGSDWLLWLEVLARSQGRMYYMDEVLAKYRRHSGNLTNTSDWKFEDQLVTLALVATKWPHLMYPARLRSSEIYFMQAAKAFSSEKYAIFFYYLLNSTLVGFPIFLPWARLLLREGLFVLKRQSMNDDILKSFWVRRQR